MKEEREKISAGSMVELIGRYAAERPERLCVADPRRAYTYEEFAALVDKKAGALKRLGIRRGDRVMARASQRGDYLALHFAAHRLGAVFVPVERSLPEEGIGRLQRITGAGQVFYDSRIEGESGGTSLGSWPWPEPEETATILFTTGTTGASKGIELSHRAEVAVAQNVYYGTQMEEGTVELVPMPVNHSYGLRHCLGLLLGGQSIVLCDGVTMAEDFYRMMDRYEVNALSLTPAAFNILRSLSGERLGDYAGRLRYLQLGTAGVPPAMKRQLRTLLPQSRLYQYYSSTEAGCACIFDFREDMSPERVGRPACNARFAVMDEKGRIIESSREHWGYLACAGPMNMTGYYGEPEQTRRTVKDGYVRSQDIGYIDSEGYVCFVGRAGDVINTGGSKVAPEEVENAALLFGGIRECACCGEEDALLGQVPKLYVTPENAAEDFDTAGLARYLAGCLESWKQPREIRFLSAVPRNYMGKLQRGRCREAWLREQEGGETT